MNQFRKHNAFHPKLILMRRLSQSSVVEPTNAVNILSAICAVAFILYLPARIWQLRISRAKNALRWQGRSKAALGILLSFILLIYAVTVHVEHEIILVISLLASSGAAFGLSLLLVLEQQRSLRPSDLAILYLVPSIICDVLLLTMPSKIQAVSRASRPILARCLIHSTLFVFEICDKRPSASSSSNLRSPEESRSVLDRVLYTWINPILLQGYTNILVDQDLPRLSRDMKPEFTRKAMLQTWSRRAKPDTKNSLPLTLMKCLKQPFFAAVIPRLFLIAFRYSQPTLIKESIKYVVAYPATEDSSQGFWLVVSAMAIYVGLALSTAVYQHRINRLKLMTRGALVGLIHAKTMESPSIAYDNGEATTLMSTDADSLDGIAEMVHETWAQVIEVLIGIRLLAIQVGWIWSLPLFLIYLCSHMSRFVAKHLQPHQKAWNSATQSRIAATSSFISAMKVVKMIGFQHNLNYRVQQLRKEELWVASKLRWVMVYYNASANALGIFSPAITLAIFAVISQAYGIKFDTTTAFPTMAILSMVTHPANMVMTIVPRAVAAFAGFERIQSFLLRPSLQDNRGTLPRPTQGELAWNPAAGHLTKPNPAVQIHQLRVGNKQIILDNINIGVRATSFVIISGPTGSGKSTLLRTIIGEVIPAAGSITLSTRKIAYCAQRPWLPSGTIKEVIYGAKDIDSAITHDNEKWYDTVAEICCLTHDFDTLPDGDQTQIGSRGLNLSGGQRQRVTLARALFARSDMLLLDDTFSGLDGDTEQTIFDNLFGYTGLMRRLKTTVILVSNSSQYFQSADHVVVLGDNGIIDQGNWQSIKIKAGSIAKFSSGSHTKDNATVSAAFAKLSAQVRAKDEAEIDLARQSGDPALYGYYLKFVESKNLFLLIAYTASYAFFITIPQYYLQLWTDSSGGDTVFYVSGFLFLSFMSWITTSFQMWAVLIRLAPQSGSRLHERLLHIVTSAPLSYFSQTGNGSILNRFSQDIQLVDKQLPPALQTIITQTFKLLMQVILLFIAQKWLVVCLPACILVVYVVQKVYLRTSRQLRFLELEARAGVFSSFLESVEGLETIRSFGWSNTIIQDNIISLDNAQRPEFLLLCLQRWLNVVLDLLAAAVATSVIAIAIAYRDRVSGAQVGIALNIMLVANTTLIKLVESWTALEISLGAIARLRTLEKMTPFEGGMTWNLEPAESWPSRGDIEFKNITASYISDSMALRNLSLNIISGQKIIVCGRTGSGKSTLLLTLLRLLELQSGQIVLDGIDIKKVGLDILRQRCFITVSQDPLLLFNESLRFNLDPDAALSNEALIASLDRTELWEHFKQGSAGMNEILETESGLSIDNLPYNQHPILDMNLSMLSELSVGQGQLLALCRALVKAQTAQRSGRKPVVLLDEVTSSLDPGTESVIHGIIDDEFTQKGHTVICVAHRIEVLAKHTEPGRDVVVLLGDGRLQEVFTDLNLAMLAKLERFN
ncbi:uncharacterized protein EAE97_005783 [Botrytis byssoidea]|uniref:ABC transporter n=1 Tax=Botrytis byssoidea TaxID=139641 RepID=A0A9P5IM77_9HELO|nr:uncharacterized protein EAE97_005783 [Botrytis byssoidea]KAF7943713.1 hypothetical protein EAE97_005783 [Botrytis byssoidea]